MKAMPRRWGFVLRVFASIAAAVLSSHAHSQTNLAIASRDEQMKALRQQVDDAEAAYTRSFGKKSEGEIEQLWNACEKLDQTNLPQIFELARQEPTSATSIEMFKWIVVNRQIHLPSLYTNGVQSLGFLRNAAATDTNLARVCLTLGRDWDPNCRPAVDFLKLAAKENPDRDVRGQAVLALARLDKQESDDLEFWENAPSGSAGFEKSRTNFFNGVTTTNSQISAGEAKKLFHAVLKHYADCPSLIPTNTWHVKATLGGYAKGDLFELEHLSVGDVAPDMEGDDIDGKTLKLSDYRGKIVVLSFWASWCGPCMGMVPSEIRLANRLKGKPFAFVGVNGDPRKEDARRAVERKKMSWPSFWTEKGPDGPIPTAWNVSGWPTVYILDPNGVIRFKCIGYGPDTEKLLDGKVDQLLDE